MAACNITRMEKKTGTETYKPISHRPRGTGPSSGGQSGDTQGLTNIEDMDSESVEELVEEGQYLEAELISGIENAPNADQGPVRTKAVPEDDVPTEYIGPD